MWRNGFILIIIIGVSMLLGGCGEDVQVHNDATVTVTPASGAATSDSTEELLEAKMPGEVRVDALVEAPSIAVAEVTYEVGPSFDRMAQAEILFVGRVTAAQAGPSTMSLPPIQSFQLTFDVSDSLRGGLAAGETVTLSYQVQQNDPPTFTTDEDYVVAAKVDVRSERTLVTWLSVADEQLLSDAELAGAIPLGWRIEDGDLLSPWALMDGAWPADADADADADGGMVCAVTGRPALLAGEGVTLSSEKVPPAEEIKWSNPDGDGQYTITVTNTTDEAIEVPALLSDADGILWAESLVIVCQRKVQACPGAEGVSGETFGTVLKPGQSVSGVINAFGLEGIEWPRGGYRVEFTFCLGELAVTESFYYKSDHHDAIRLGDETPAE